MKKLLVALVASLLALPAWGQSVLQGGPVTPGHAAYWVTNGVVGDAGAAPFANLTSIGTVGQGPTICANSGPPTGPYNQLCLAANTNSPAQIILQNVGGAPAETLQCVINGVTSSCLSGGGGGGTPGGSSGQVQYNNGGVFGGISGATSNGTTVTFASSDLLLGSTTFASAGSGTITFPAATGTVALTSGANVASVSNSDGTLTISPTTGAVVGSLALGHANTWTAAQTFTNSDIKLLGSSTGATTFTSGNSSASNFTLTFPAATDTLAAIGTAQTWTAAQTFTNSDIKLLGSSTGATTFTSGNSSASNFTITFPGVTDTVAVLGTADQVVAGGANVTTQGLTTGNVTIDCGSRPLQKITNGGAFTITAPANDGSCILLVTNNASAGAITFTSFSVGSNTGDALTTTNTSKFSIFIWEINGVAGYRIAAHQ